MKETSTNKWISLQRKMRTPKTRVVVAVIFYGLSRWFDAVAVFVFHFSIFYSWIHAVLFSPRQIKIAFPTTDERISAYTHAIKFVHFVLNWLLPLHTDWIAQRCFNGTRARGKSRWKSLQSRKRIKNQAKTCSSSVYSMGPGPKPGARSVCVSVFLPSSLDFGEKQNRSLIPMNNLQPCESISTGIRCAAVCRQRSWLNEA